MKKPKRPELKKVEELTEDEPVERLKVNTHGAEAADELVVDFEEDKALGKDLDMLLAEEKIVKDTEIDKLFSEKKSSKHDELEVEVRKALYQQKTSKASLLRGNKSAEVTKKTREEEIANYKSLEDEWDEHIDEKVKHGKTVYVIAVLVIALIAAAGVWALLKVSSDDEVAHKDIHDQRQQTSLDKKEAKEDVETGINQVEAVLKKFVKAQTTEEKMKFLYDAERLKKEIEAYYAKPKNQVALINVNIDRVVEELVMGKKVWSIVFSHGPNGAKEQSFYFFRKNAQGEYKIDWDTISGRQAYDWKTFVKNRSTTPIEVRALVVPQLQDGQYNWGFTDDEYFAYKLFVGDDKVFWGYLHKDQRYEVRRMNELVSTTIAYQRVYPSLRMKLILKIKFPEGTNELNDQCVEITEIVSPHWIDLRDPKNEKSSEPKENGQ